MPSPKPLSARPEISPCPIDRNGPPWIGAARPLSSGAFDQAAEQLNCESAALKAVWEVEASGRHFDSANHLLRRFEPHHFPRKCWEAIGFRAGGTAPWRASLRLSESAREAMLLRACAINEEAALRAASWGAPQIMGFNAEAAGHASARAMVEAMAESADAQLAAFVALIRDWGLASALRAHDWAGFARRYNGSGRVEEYARRIEAAYRRHAGARSPEVLRTGDRGTAVRRLQRALEIEDDGVFGPQTHARVIEFQESMGLEPDGVVGARSWAALKELRGASAPAQHTPLDANLDRIKSGAGAASAVAASVAAFSEALPESALVLLLAGCLVLAGIAVSAWAIRWVRG